MTDLPNQQYSDDTLRVLLIEDNPGDIRLLEEAFDGMGGNITLQTVSTGDDALELLTESSPEAFRPNFVLLDLSLPGKDGYDVLETIRDHSQLQVLPVVVLTGSQAGEDVVKSYQVGANAYVTKPADPEAFFSLAETIEQFWFQQARLPPITT